MFDDRQLPPITTQPSDPNMTDVNGAPGAMDEDGELDTEGNDSDVNTSPEGEAEEDDQSPLIHGMALKVEHLPGMDTAQTTIVVTLYTGTGIDSKRMVLAGEVTAQKLAVLLCSVAYW